MTRLSTAALAVGVALAVLGPVGAVTAQPLANPGEDAVAGSRLFGARGCVRCHAVGGKGGRTGPDLGRGQRPRTFYDLAAALWNHAPAMSDRMRALGIARPQLDAREAANVVAFLYTVDYFDTGGRPEAGRLVFRDKQCIACHQLGGAGGVVGPALDGLKRHGSPIYVATAMWNHGPQMATAMAARRIARPTFRDDELRDLLAYIAAASPVIPEGPLYVLPGNADAGRRAFAEKRCAECHPIGGAGGRGAPDLAASGASRNVTRFAQVMWNKAPAMAEAMRARAITVPTLTPETMADIVAYLYSVRYFAQAGDANKGAAVASAKGCLTCHARGGETDLSRAGAIRTPGAIVAALWNHAFLAEPRAERAQKAWAPMRAEEMADLMAFLSATARRP